MPHIHDKIDFTVEVFIVYKNEVLLRKHDKYKIWLSVGDHIELDEDPNLAAVREVKEEVGLDIQLYHDGSELTKLDGYTELIPPQFMNRHRINDTHEHVSLIYFARAKTNKLVLCEKEKSDECRWFTMEDLEDKKYDLSDKIKMYARSALGKLSEC